MFLPTPRKANWMPFPDTPQRLLLTFAATAIASLGFGASAAEAASPTALSVLSPGDDSLETGTVDIKVHVPAGATKVTARVAGKNVALHGTGAIRTASVPVASLRPAAPAPPSARTARAASRCSPTAASPSARLRPRC